MILSLLCAGIRKTEEAHKDPWKTLTRVGGRWYYIFVRTLAGLTRRQKKYEIQDLADRAIELRMNGYSYREIAEKIDVPKHFMSRLLSAPKEIVDIVRARAKGKCEHCGKRYKRGFGTHHHRYDTMKYNDLKNLMLLCYPCHMRIHRVGFL